MVEKPYKSMYIETAIKKERTLADKTTFDWDENKNRINKKKHNISFEDAQYTFSDTKRIIAKDLEHSESEKRFYCFEKVENSIVTVRFTYRNNKIRIIGAGYWRKGKQNIAMKKSEK